MTKTSTDPGSKSAAELETEVAGHRAEVEHDLQALQDRLSPGQIVDQLFDYAKNGNGAEFTRNLGRSVRDNPLPVALMGVGMAWLMMGGAGESRGRRYDTYDDYDTDSWLEEDDDPALYAHTTPVTGMPGDRGTFGTTGARNADSTGSGNGLKDKVGHAMDDMKARAGAAGDRIGETRDRAGEALGRAGDSMRRAGDKAAAYGREADYRARRYADRAGRAASRYGRKARRGFFQSLEDQPLVLGAIGVAIGAAIGAALPATEREDEFMGETRDELKRHTIDTAEAEAKKAGDMANAAYGAAKQEAENQGLTPRDAKSEAGTMQDKASKVADAAKTAAEKEAQKA
jgi:hypothetical protein